MQIAAVLRRRFNQPRSDRLAFTLRHAIHRARAMRQDLFRSERRTVTADKKEHSRMPLLRLLRKIDNFRNIRQIVHRKPNRIRLPLIEQPEIILMGKNLEIKNANVMSLGQASRSHQFQPNRLQPQKHLRRHETAGMDKKNFGFLACHEMPFNR